MITTSSSGRKPGLATRRTTSRAAAPLERQSRPEPLDTELIRCRAYEIFLGRNGEPGDPLGDWVQAERELCGEARGYPAPVRPRDEDTIRGASGDGPLPRDKVVVRIRD